MLSSCKGDEPGKDPVDPKGGGTTVATKATAISLEQKTLSLVEGTKKKLVLKFTPANATNKSEVEWSVQKPNVASVTDDGEVLARRVGETKVTARLGNLKAVCMLTVKKKEYPKIDVTVEQTFVTPIKVGFKVRLKDQNLNYFCDVTTKKYFYGEKVKAVGGIIEDEKTWWRLGLGTKNKDKAWSEVMPDVRKVFFRTGDLDYDSSAPVVIEDKDTKKLRQGNGSGLVALEWGQEYVFYMFTLDDDGNQTSEVFTKEFSVPKLKIDNNLTFDIKIDGITEKTCNATVTPSDPNASYYFTIQPKSFWNSRQNFTHYPNLGLVEGLMHENFLKAEKHNIKTGKYEIIGGEGESTEHKEYLKEFNNYEKTKERVLYVFGVDKENGPITLITHKEFRLKD